MLFVKDLKDTESILLLQDRAILNAVDQELIKVLDNIEDKTTEATKKRKISITLEIEPSVTREKFRLNATVSSSLAPKSAMQMSLDLKSSSDGDYIIQEEKDQAAGQMDMYGKEESSPARLQFHPRMIGENQPDNSLM